MRITASGGAFRDWPLSDLALATVEQASSHPNWNMGQRITIDSASMFNKALELIETKEFFQIDPARIEAVVHPESMVHQPMVQLVSPETGHLSFLWLCAGSVTTGYFLCFSSAHDIFTKTPTQADSENLRLNL